MQTITVVFSDKVLPLINLEALKTYKFLCNYDNIKAYDIITDPRYTGKMLVIGTSSCTDRVQGGRTLKDIYITEINGHPICQPAGLVLGSLVGNDHDIDKQRNIKVTLEQAIEWYNSGNTILRTLALSAYTENELKFNFQYISSKVRNTCVCITVPTYDGEKYSTLADLAVIAKYFNGNWKKTTRNTGYFLGNYSANNGSMVDCCNGAGVYKHSTLQYAGVVYFKNQEDAIKAVKILGKRVESLFD